MVEFRFALIELFLAIIYYGSKFIRRNVYSSAVFTKDQPFYTQILPWHQKTRDSGLPDGEDPIPLRSFVLTLYWNVTDRQTDRRTD